MLKIKRSYGMRTTITIMVCAVLSLVLMILYVIFSNRIIPQTRHALEDKALTIARTLALMPLVSEGLEQGNSRDIQAYTAKITRRNDILFVVVLDMNSIRYSHPNPEQVGRSFQGGGQQRVMKGEESLSVGQGTLGKSLRAFVPVYDGKGHQVGAVVVGLALDRVQATVKKNQWTIIAILLSGALLGALGAIILARKIKKMVLGMEPSEISKLLQERSAMLQSIREGIIAVDHNGRITLINTEAERLLGLAGVTGNGMTRFIADFWPELHLEVILATGEELQDQELVLNGVTLLVSRVPITVDGQIVGAIATFRDKTELIVLSERLSGISVYADALRAGAHEFKNKLHVIMGMTHMRLYDELQQYISDTVSNHQQEIGQITRQIKDPVMAGFLLGKCSRARELGVHLILTPDSYLPECEDAGSIHELITIAGNLLDNAMDAVESVNQGEVRLSFLYEEGRLLCMVEDNGPGMSEATQEQAFIQGYSTKGEQRGMGLYLVRKSVDKLQGQLELETETASGTLFTVDIPYAAGNGEIKS